MAIVALTDRASLALGVVFPADFPFLVCSPSPIPSSVVMLASRALPLMARAGLRSTVSSQCATASSSVVAFPFASSSSACAIPSSASASFHTSRPTHGIFTKTPEEKVEAEQKTHAKIARAQWSQFKDILMAPSGFTLGGYEKLVASQAGEAAPGAGLLDRAKAAVGAKIRSWQGGEQATPAEVAASRVILGALTPEEKALKVLSPEAKQRIHEKTGYPMGELELVLARFDQFLATSEWLHWRQQTGRVLPSGMADMQDRMREDRRNSKMPRFSKMDLRAKSVSRQVSSNRKGRTHQ